jgi:murein DD-endopeptidase MepM/ murein hydrolase activator NlpD
MVVVKGENLITVYTHNERNRARLGDVVEKGDWIADVGSSGNATGPHLHLETRVLDETGRWAAVDPAIFFKSGF